MFREQKNWVHYTYFGHSLHLFGIHYSFTTLISSLLSLVFSGLEENSLHLLHLAGVEMGGFFEFYS